MSKYNSVEKRGNDWICTNCNYINFKRNTECRKCSPSFIEKENNKKEDNQNKNNKGGGMGNYVPHNDWICTKCNYLNFKRNRICKKCERNNSKWVCIWCQVENSKSNHFCWKCKKDENGNIFLNSDWICHHCFTINEIDYSVGKKIDEVVCICGERYTSQNQPNLTINQCYNNNYECAKKVYENLNFFVDWDCLKNINCGISNALDLLHRKDINKNNILCGIKYVVSSRDPDTGHYSDCLCDGCLLLDRGY